MGERGSRLHRGFERAPFGGVSLTLPIDVGLVAATVAAIVSHKVVTWFHIIFVLLVVAALMLPFRQFLLRLILGMTATVALVVWAVSSLDTPSEELTELPLLTLVLVMVYWVAHGRSLAIAERETAYLKLNDRADLELDDVHRQLEQSQRLELLGRTTTGLAHDLRNVFVVVRGCVDEICGDEVIDEAAVLAEIAMSADRGVAIIDDLLWIGRQQQHTTVAIDLPRAVREIEPLLRRLTSQRLSLHIDGTSDGSPQRVFVDRVTLTQVLMNLVSNADDAIDGDGEIVVAARTVLRSAPGASPAEVALITVTDTGKGFTPDALVRAFESDFSTKGDHHSGLGLNTVWRLVERYGGTVNVDSSSSSGTTVSVLLPTCLPGDERTFSDDTVNGVPTHSLINPTLLADTVDHGPM